jgi:hypothetical protein
MSIRKPAITRGGEKEVYIKNGGASNNTSYIIPFLVPNDLTT